MNDNYTTDFFNVVTPEQLTSQSFITEDGVKVVNLQMKAHNGSFEAMKKYALPYDAPFTFLWRITWEKEDEIYLSFLLFPQTREPANLAQIATDKERPVEIYLGRRDPIFSDGDFQITFIANRKDVSMAINDGITLSSLLNVSTSKHLASRQQMIESLIAKKYKCKIEKSACMIKDNFTEEITVRSFLFSEDRILFFPFVRWAEFRTIFKFSVRDFSEFKQLFLMTFGTSDLCDAIKKGDMALNDFLRSDKMINGKLGNENNEFARLYALFRFFFDLPQKTKHVPDSNIIDLIDISQSGHTRHHASHWNPPLGITNNLLEVLTRKDFEKLIKTEFENPGYFRSKPEIGGGRRLLPTSEIEYLTKAMQTIIGHLSRSDNYCDEVIHQILLKWQSIFNEASFVYRDFCDEISTKTGKELIDNVATEELLDTPWKELFNLYEKKYLSFRDTLIPIVFHFPYLQEKLVRMLSTHNELAKRILLAFARKLLLDGNNQKAALEGNIFQKLQDRIKDIQIHFDMQMHEIEKENLGHMKKVLSIYNRNVETDVDLLNTIHEIINNISAKVKAEAAQEEREQLLYDLSHNIKNIIIGIKGPIERLASSNSSDPNFDVSCALKGANMISRIVWCINNSYRSTHEDFVKDINNPSKDALSFGEIIDFSLRNAIANMFDKEYHCKFVENFFTDSFIEAYSAWKSTNNPQMISFMNTYMTNCVLDMTEECRKIIIGNTHGSATKVMLIINEIILNALKAVSFIRKKEQRFIKINIYFSNTGFLTIDCCNSFKGIESGTGHGRIIIDNFVKSFSGTLKCSDCNHIFQISINIPLTTQLSKTK